MCDGKDAAPLRYVPGKPWTQVIPHPDDVDWSRLNRPGYRYRGMTETQRRFYEYIKHKRSCGRELSWAELRTIRLMKSKRVWPEPPVPTERVRQYLIYLRDKDTLELSLCESLLLGTVIKAGMWPRDHAQHRDLDRMRDYLNAGPYEARNWWERWFGRVEPLMDVQLASWGYDMRDQSGGGAPAGVYPATGDINGCVIRYNVSGATLGESVERTGFTYSRHYAGAVHPGTLTVSGTAMTKVNVRHKLTVRVSAGAEQQTFDEDIAPEKESTRFSLSVPVAPGTTAASFSIHLTLYSPYGSRSLVVSGALKQSAADAASQRAKADAQWRAEVERTLAKLGYEQTPAGREVREMREALAGSDAAWQAFVNRRLRELGYDDSPRAAEFRQLRQAMDQGGRAWEQYAAAHGGPAAPATQAADTPTPPAAGTTPRRLPDIGGLAVGTTQTQGRVTGAAEHFHRAQRVTGVVNFTNLPQGSTAVGIWTREGSEIMRSKQTVGGNGWVSFSLKNAAQAGLRPGTYTLTIMVGNTVLGRKTFTIGQPRG
ncbi:MAG: hypothetical protein KKI08_09275 [Armatimonadetes bacterium]|nr:hypothetical protein [Armatimonadota bacterium]